MDKQLITVRLDDLVPYARNARKNDATVPELAKDIEQVGYISPIIIDENNEILAGHTRLRALQQLGWKEAQVIKVTGLASADKRKFRLYDNKVGEKSQWDIPMLAEEIADLDFGDLQLDWKIPEIEIAPPEPAYYGHTRERSFKTDNFCDYDGSRVEGPYHFPVIKPSHHRPKELLGFDHMLPSKEYHKGIHFYLYDYMFERIWNSPQQYMEKLSRFDCVIGPDFSLYTDMPVAQQIWNHYRNNLLAQMMQDYGIEVIPPIMWSTPDTFEWCFDGLPHNSVLAVETVGCCQDKESRELWHLGMDAAMKKLTPECIVLYGSDIGYDFGGTEVIHIANTNGERMKKSKEKKATK